MTNSTNNKGTKPTSTPHVVKSPALVANCLNKSSNNNDNSNSKNDNSLHLDAKSATKLSTENTKPLNGSSNNKITNEVTKASVGHIQKPTAVNADENMLIGSKPRISKASIEEDKVARNDYAFQDDGVYDLSGVPNEQSIPAVPEYDDMEEYDDECDETVNDNYGGGIRERSLLCPILEEDAESTASTSSLASRVINT